MEVEASMEAQPTNNNDNAETSRPTTRGQARFSIDINTYIQKTNLYVDSLLQYTMNRSKRSNFGIPPSLNICQPQVQWANRSP
ncbi:hypothetical protein BHE90_007779 [Fusarium euwallaceae]|uniref:Uncharacterized protein n=4 Tax=Fusarium solani species complex TaxID=232080 RepID=A0A3M2RMH5_9HYPO|nr:hypothetical protein CDV36_013849 [Fusarium kuroshium]RSL71014.1 hypothetical protein CEP51_012101 [Fusarium floridanum]RSL99733.1 hypothetical protein CEP52_009533 [Fusarium oligoseptatum]RTE77727.1 hypothetical protein BHE90_007779 [Fusarium euwallaceae]